MARDFSGSYDIKCRRCRVSAEGVGQEGDSDPERVRCPQCGISEDFQVVLTSIEEQLLDMADEKLKKAITPHLRPTGLIRISYEGRSAAKKARNAASKFFIDLNE